MLHRSRIRFASVLMLGVATLAFSVPASAENLADAITMAYQNNPELLAQRADLRATNEGYVQSRAVMGPTVGLNASRTYQYQDYNTVENQLIPGTTISIPVPVSVSQGNYQNSYSATLSQPIFTSGQMDANSKAARANVEVGRQQLRQTEISVLARVIEAYVAVRRDQQLVKIAEDNLAALDKQYSDTIARFNVRDTTATEVAQTATRRSFSAASVIEARSRLEISRSLYLQLVGQIPGILEPEPELPGLPSSIDEAYLIADASNPALLAAALRERSSRATIRSARSAYGPRVSLEVDASRSPLGSLDQERMRDVLSVRGTVQLPIFNSGLTASRVRQATAENDRDWQLIDKTRRDTNQSVASAWTRLATTRNTLEFYKKAIETAESAWAGAREQERFGTRTTLDVLNQLQELQSVRSTYVSTAASEYLARVGLLAATGKLEAPMLLAQVTANNPEADFEKVRAHGDIPTTPVIGAVDSLVVGSVKKPRPSRDPADKLRYAPISELLSISDKK